MAYRLHCFASDGLCREAEQRVFREGIHLKGCTLRLAEDHTRYGYGSRISLCAFLNLVDPRARHPVCNALPKEGSCHHSSRMVFRRASGGDIAHNHAPRSESVIDATACES